MLFGSSGIRRKFDQVLVETALHVGSSLAETSGDILVGRDTRTTSPVLAHLVIAGILGNGGRVHTAGVVPTPTVAYNTRMYKAGCMITASHNPEEYNGIKLFNPDGSSFSQLQQREIEASIELRQWTDWQKQGHELQVDALTPHKNAILEKVHPSSDRPVIIDCGNGAGSTLTPKLFSDADVQTICINCNPSGTFARPSEPLPEYLGYVGEMVRKTGATCAIVHDGDADRMMAFDSRGIFIDGDHLLMLFAKYTGAKRVVTTSDASMIIDEIAEVHRTPVGDAYVSEELVKWGDFGGEPSGAWIFPKMSLCPDGPYAAALFCEIAAEWDIEKEIDAMPTYPILRESFHHGSARDLVTAIGASSPTDGLRISGDEGWCLIRASGTEPKVRITAEGKTLAHAKEMLERGRDLVRKAKTA